VDKLISVEAAAEKLGVTPRHVRRLASQGRIKGAQKIGWAWLIPSPPKVLATRGDLEKELELDRLKSHEQLD
jgi:excisionase family DNA binding protein